MKNKIILLNDVNTFWEDVKKIIGFYNNKFWEDWQIKELQRIADYRYNQLLKEKGKN